jgi:starch-binding outer membrane protein, SusD/RagB family
MDKLENILTLGFSVLILLSCTESFLDVESKTESNTATFYKTENDAWRALIGCYDGWQCTVSNGGFAFYVASELMSDECFGGTGYADGYGYQAVDRFDIAISPSDLNLFEDTWRNYYTGVYRCNELIAHDEQIEWESNHGVYMGECHALRAILYFDMVRLWGNIPLFTEPVNENREQADPKEVYQVIFDDLQYAIDSIPSDAYPKSDAADNDGHITQAAAKALMARAYLFYTGYYGAEPEGISKATVLQGLEEIITSGEYSLIPQFKNLWPAASSSWTQEESDYVQTNTYVGDGNAETILAQKFNYTQDYNGNNDGNEWLVMMGIRSFVTVPYGQGWGSCTVNPEILKNFGTGDTRKSASAIDLEGEGITAQDGFEKNSLKDQREYTGYTVKKYTPMAEWRKGDDGNWSQVNAVVGLGNGDFQISQYQDFVVMRYADVLLMAAELGSSNAKQYLNDVRKRAYTDEEGNLSSNYSEIDATKENILKERMLEFAFEGQRYWDLLRQGVDVAANTIAISNYSVLNGGNEGTVTISTSKMTATKGLSQIPNNQITLSGNVLKQNPGW